MQLHAQLHLVLEQSRIIYLVENRMDYWCYGWTVCVCNKKNLYLMDGIMGRV